MGFDLATLYLLCALVGGSILVIQILLMVIGLDADSDVDGSSFDLDEVGEGGHGFFDYLSLKSVVAFLTFFGLAGMWIERSAWDPPTPLAVAVALGAGSLAFYVVGLIMTSLARLESSGNLELKEAMGQQVTVYLKIPAARSGAGKVTVRLSNRTVEVRAVTDGEEIATGSAAQVVGLEGSSTLEVVPV